MCLPFSRQIPAVQSSRIFFIVPFRTRSSYIPSAVLPQRVRGRRLEILLAMATDSSSSSSGIAPSQFSELMAAISGLKSDTEKAIDEKMAQLKRELVEEHGEANERLAKKLRLDSQPVFKKKGHEKQFKFNCSVEDKIKEAQLALDKTPPAVEKAKTALVEGEKLIAVRQKLIKIADRSEHGWSTVDEYMDDELADNSDDEKRLFKAEQRAGVSARKLAAVGQQPAPVTPHIQLLPSGIVMPQTATCNRPAITRPIGPCFQCGKEGHFRRFCPLLQGSLGTK